MGALAARLAGVPRIIFTAHGWAFNEERVGLQRLIIRWLHILTVILAHTTIVVSERTKEQLRAPGFLRPRMWVIHNGVQSDVSLMSKASARKALFPEGAPSFFTDSRTIWLGTIAELHRNKGLDVLIEALARVQKRGGTAASWQIGFIVIGEGEERRSLEAHIQKAGLSDSVQLVGFRADAAKLLPAFDIFTLPSRTEALPYTLLEAGVASLPVIASAVGGIPEIVSDMESGVLVRPGDARELERALHYLITEHDYLHVYGTRLHEHVARNFSIEKMLDATLRCYRHRRIKKLR